MPPQHAETVTVITDVTGRIWELEAENAQLRHKAQHCEQERNEALIRVEALRTALRRLQRETAGRSTPGAQP